MASRCRPSSATRLAIRVPAPEGFGPASATISQPRSSSLEGPRLLRWLTRYNGALRGPLAQLGERRLCTESPARTLPSRRKRRRDAEIGHLQPWLQPGPSASVASVSWVSARSQHPARRHGDFGAYKDQSLHVPGRSGVCSGVSGKSSGSAGAKLQFEPENAPSARAARSSTIDAAAYAVCICPVVRLGAMVLRRKGQLR